MSYNLGGFYNKDCMEALPFCPDNYFDLAIVDPPYGININRNMGRRRWLERLAEQGYAVAVFYDWADAAKAIEAYLRQKNDTSNG
ncbi:MAG: hypothetical protein RR235_08260 [Oscillospiraceae bacterium]